MLQPNYYDQTSRACLSSAFSTSFVCSRVHFTDTLCFQVPKSVEDKLPDALHDTGSNKDTGKVSHATGDSIVPKTLQEGLPEKVEKAVPNAIHDTSGAKFSDGSVSK